MTSDGSSTREAEAKEFVQLGVRIPRSLHFALKPACLQQECEGKAPQTQADAVADAIRLWLKRNGHDK